MSLMFVVGLPILMFGVLWVCRFRCLGYVGVPTFMLGVFVHVMIFMFPWFVGVPILNIDASV